MNKKVLLAISLFALLIVQQVQASTITPSQVEQSIHSAPSYAYLDHVWLYVLKLHQDGSKIVPEQLCNVGDTDPGCAEPGYSFPSMNNPIYIDVENEYLSNVLPHEMDVQSNYPTLPALQAQAVAARTYSTWAAINKPYDDPWDYNYNNQINNSTDYQVYYPDAYEHFTNPADPEGVKQMISEAIASTLGQHLASTGDVHVIDAEFGGDVLGHTESEGTKNYLLRVEDPISTICGAVTNYSGWGMSQKGALRWSRGNQCATGGDEATAWSVRWDDYRQILVHYYTGIDILDAGGNPVAPNGRWNLLWHDNFGFNVGTTPVLNNAHLYPLRLQLQNTSVTDWAENEITLAYQWTGRGADRNPANWLPLTTLPALEKGASTPDRVTSPLTVLVPAPCGTGDYTLHLDVGRNNVWFSTANWPDARIDVNVQLSAPQATAGRGYYTDGLGARYYNDRDDGQWQIDGPITWQTFSPPVVFSTVEPSINFDTDTSSPAPGVNGTFWSAIWEGNLYVPQTGQYRFYLGGLDDGGRLILDGVTRIESWLVQGPHEYFSPSLNLAQGLHAFRVEYAQGPGSEAGLSVCWEGPNFVKEVIGASGPISGQPTPTPFMPPTLLPSATPTPTATATLVPTPTPWWGWWVAAEEAALQDEPLAVRQAYSTLLSRVRDEVMQPDPKGEAYIRLVYRHAPEITALLLNDASLRGETRALMLEVRPLLEDLLGGKMEAAQLSADWVKRALVLLEKVEKKASPALKGEIRWWRVWLPRFVGKTGREIWEMLPPRQAGRLPQTEGNPEELVLQSLSGKEARAFGHLLSRVRDEKMRPSKGGEVYVSLVYRYTPEVVSILLNDDRLRQEAESLLLEARPGLEFWLGQRKEGWVFSEDWVKRMEALLAELTGKGSAALRAEAAWWQARVPEWTGKTPQEVWESLLRESRVRSSP